MTESASRPPCGFWRIDDRQLEVEPCVKSFVEYHIEKGNTNALLKFIWHTMMKKGKVAKTFEDYGALILFLSYKLRTIKGDT
jgi:hypothetical protein